VLHSYPTAPNANSRVFWIDLLDPTAEEVARIQTEFGVKVPAREKLDEIESSSRLRVEGDTLYLSMPIGAQHDVIDAAPTPVGFVLSPELLVTVRYTELQSFINVGKRFDDSGRCFNSASTFATLLEEMVDFGADLLEKNSSNLGGISRRVFKRKEPGVRRATGLNRILREMLTTVGYIGEHLSQIRETLLGLERIIDFASEVGGQWLQQQVRARLKTARQDLSSLADFEANLSGKTQFLLDAILGFINTEQNDIFKVLTIVSVVGVPPTLIASMYGMNFHNMPELSWPWGYQYGLCLIAVSILAPILWFKWRGWW
jgi:magnesium transporter